MSIFNNAMFKTNALKSWIENTETVTVTRRTPAGGVQNITTIYSGAADVQYKPGTLSYDPSGAVVQFDAMAIIDADSSGNLPAIKNGDFLAVGTDILTVMTTDPNNLYPAHLELKCKRGGIPYSGSGHR